MSDPIRLGEGIHYDVPESAYHADPAPEPSLSSSLARLLLERSPKHARYAHPRLNPRPAEDKSNAAMTDGTILHKLTLGAGAPVHVIQAVYDAKHKLAGKPVRDMRTKMASEEAAAAIAEGKTPILPARYAELQEAKGEALLEIASHPDMRRAFNAPGHAEVTMIWREPIGIWCRARVDWMPDDPSLPLFDLKTTKLSAAPAEWERRLQRIYAFQDAFYRRGAIALGRKPGAGFLFGVLEQDAPYCMSALAADPSLQAVAEAQVERAIGLWARSMQTGAWPGYAKMTAYVSAPAWLTAQAEEQAMRDELLEEEEV